VLIRESKFYFIGIYIHSCKFFAPKNKCLFFPFYGVNCSNFEVVLKFFFGTKRNVLITWYHAIAGIILGEQKYL
jgi:hypothetical protein